MKPSRKTSILQTYVTKHPLTSYDGYADSDDITTSVQPSSVFLYNQPTGSVMRSRRNTFTYGQSGEGSSQQLVPPGLNMDSQLVPYAKEWTVILRNETAGQLVLYNATNRRVSVRRLPPNNNPQPQALITPNTCTYCGRPFETNHHRSGAGSSSTDFIHRNYFRLLENSESVHPESLPIGEPYPFTEPSTEFTFINSHEEEIHATLSHDSFNQGYYERFFIEEKKLGRGFRGSVYLCKHVLDNVQLGVYAVKKVAVGDDHAWLVRMLREVHLLEKLHHPNIVDYKHAWLENHQLTNFGPQVPCLFILMEFANGRNLEEYIEHSSTFSMQQDPEEAKFSTKERILRARRMRHAPEQSSTRVPSKRSLNLQEIWLFFIDICEGLAHLHRHGIVHRDLKPPNLLLHYDEERTAIPRVLISDFGECEILDQLSERDRTGATGTLEFMAPELLSVDEGGNFYKDYSPKSDMWSLGMVLYYLCYSRLPYHQVDDVDLLKEEILHFEGVSFPESLASSSSSYIIPLQLKNLIKLLLSKNKKIRPSCDEILKSVGDIRAKFANNVYNEAPVESSFNPHITSDPTVQRGSSKLVRIPSNNTIVSLSSQEDVELSPDLEFPVLSDNSTTSKVDLHPISMLDDSSTEPSDSANLRRRNKIVEKVQVLQETINESSSNSGVERNFDVGQTSIVQNDSQTAIVRASPLRNSLYKMLCAYKFESGWWRVLKFFMVVLKITTCLGYCSPYLPPPLMLYPVIIFAMMDLYT
ncbi:14708_t:CDS:10 [Funneliformis mosseae]|uniref:non-specific serine/threonine protein kinase n=1 Tax=Funneliformis mosseae TaxID=27381 RepID=A0A9N8V9P2_FUNMO|nr:14708_t:CDS:10 [Funneliformis mosseae]